MSVPRGATHFTNHHGHDSFWKRAVEKYCYEFEPDGEAFYAWYAWDAGKWVKQTGVRDTCFKRIEDYETTSNN